MSRRRSDAADEKVGQQGDYHGIQEDDHEQSDTDFPFVLGQSGVDRPELPLLGEFIAFPGLHRFSSNSTASSTGYRKINASQMFHAAASTRAYEAAQFRITASMAPATLE